MDSPVRVASRHFGHAPAQSPSASYNGHSEMWFAPHGRRIWEWRRPVEKSQAVYAGGRCRIKYGPPSFTRHVHGPVQNRNWTTFHSPRSWAAQLLTCSKSFGSHVLSAYTSLFMCPYFGPYSSWALTHTNPYALTSDPDVVRHAARLPYRRSPPYAP
jgi:hypothetical protein